MKKISKIIIFVLVCVFAVLFSACSEDKYNDNTDDQDNNYTEDKYSGYVSSGLEPKTKIDNSEERDSDKWYSDMELHLFTTYSEYYEFDIDLGYTEAYFELNSLLIFLREDNSSDNVKFVEILEKDGKLCPVLERNSIGVDEPVTADIILYVFYAEIPNSRNYTVGEVINKYRTEYEVL